MKIKKPKRQILFRIFTQKNIIELGEKFIEAFKSLESEHKKFSIILLDRFEEEFTIDDITEYSNEIKNLISNKKIKKITFSVTDYRSNNHATFNIEETEYEHFLSSDNNSFNVEGSNKEWVNNLRANVEDILVNVEEQKKIYHRAFPYLMIIAAFGIGTLSIYFLIFLLRTTGYQPSDTSDLNGVTTHPLEKLPKFMIEYGFSWFVGLILISPFWSSAKKLVHKAWPIMEFDFGPSHLNKSKRIRNAFWALITMVIVPNLLTIILAF